MLSAVPQAFSVWEEGTQILSLRQLGQPAGLKSLPEQGDKEGRREHPLLSTYSMPGLVLDILPALSPCEVESFFLLIGIEAREFQRLTQGHTTSE